MNARAQVNTGTSCVFVWSGECEHLWRMLTTFLHGTSEKLLGRSKCQVSGGVAPCNETCVRNGSDFKSEAVVWCARMVRHSNQQAKVKALRPELQISWFLLCSKTQMYKTSSAILVERDRTRPLEGAGN